METTYNFLLDLALILLTTKILGLVTRRYNMPQVVGALLAGLMMGPACLNILHLILFDFLQTLEKLCDKLQGRTGSTDRKSTRLNSSHIPLSRMPSSA